MSLFLFPAHHLSTLGQTLLTTGGDDDCQTAADAVDAADVQVTIIFVHHHHLSLTANTQTSHTGALVVDVIKKQAARHTIKTVASQLRRGGERLFGLLLFFPLRTTVYHYRHYCPCW